MGDPNDGCILFRPGERRNRRRPTFIHPGEEDGAKCDALRAMINEFLSQVAKVANDLYHSDHYSCHKTGMGIRIIE